MKPHPPPLRLQRLFWDLHSFTWDSGGDPALVHEALRWARTLVPRGGAILDPGSFSAAISVSVLQCIAEPLALLREARRVLRAGGPLLPGVKAVPGTHGRPPGPRGRSWFSPVKRVASTASWLHSFTAAGGLGAPVSPRRCP